MSHEGHEERNEGFAANEDTEEVRGCHCVSAGATKSSCEVCHWLLASSAFSRFMYFCCVPVGLDIIMKSEHAD